MKLLLSIFIVLLIPFSGKTQPDNKPPKSQQVKPFQDYTKCFYGFVTNTGDTILSPRYDRVTRASGPRNESYWEVRIDKYVGLIDLYGKEIVPCIYIGYKRQFDYTISVTTDSGKKGVYSTEGEMLLEPLYEDIRYGLHQGRFIEVEIAGKKGLFDTNYNKIFDAKYKYIQSFPPSGIQPQQVSTDDILFRLYDENTSGILNSRSEVLVPFENWDVYPLFKRDKQNGYEPIFVVRSRETGKTGVLDQNGVFVLPMEHLEVRGFSMQKDTWIDVLICTTEEGHFAHHLETGKRSGFYISMQPFGDKFIAEGPKGVWNILNADYTPVYSDENYVLYPTSRYYVFDENVEDEYYYEDQVQWYSSIGHLISSPFLDPESNLIYTISPRKTKRSGFRKKVKVKYPQEIGLYNYITHKELPGRYDAIQVKHYQGEEYFWTFKAHEDDWIVDYETPKDHRLTVTVFDRSMNPVKSFEVLFNPVNQSDQLIYQSQNDSLALYFRLNNGKIGAVTPDGQTVIPFEYDNLKTHARRYSEILTESHWKYILKNKSGCGLFDENGKNLIPAIHDTINLTGHHNYVGVDDGVYTWYTDSFEFVLSGITSFRRRVNPEISMKYRYMPQYMYQFVANGKLYYYEVDSLLLMDDKHLYFDTALKNFDGYLLNRKGEIVADSRFNIREYESLFLLSSGKELKILNSDGTQTIYLDNVLWTDVASSRLRIATTERKTGVVNGRTGNWTIPPDKYCEVVPIRLRLKNYCIKETEDSPWYIVDAEGKRLFSEPLSAPLDRIDDYTIVRHQSHMGIINGNLEILLPIRYDYIYRSTGDIFYVKDEDGWRLWSKEKGFFTKAFDEISTFQMENKLIVFKDDQIGIIDINGEFIVNYMNEDSLMKQYDLVELFGLKAGVPEHTLNYMGIILRDKPAKLYEEFSERNFVRYIRSMTTRTDRMLINDSRTSARTITSKPGYARHFNRTETQQSYGISYATDKYLSYATNVYKEFNGNSHPHRESEFYNYKIEQDTLRRIYLYELFKPNSGYAEKIDQLLTQHINETQALGAQCGNLKAIIKSMKGSFLIRTDGILFYESTLKDEVLLIPYTSMKDILRDPVFLE